MNHVTRSVIVANDVVGVGKVVLSSALPVLSTCQIEVIPMPTVLLSSHTGGFDKIAITDLTQATKGFINQWETLDFPCHGLITGYFKNQTQLKELAKFASKHKLSRFVDPIMADKGNLYAGYDQDFVLAMREFCKNANVITPNLTEACLLADCPYLGETYTKTDIEQLCERLSHLHNKHIILTGVSFEADNVGLGTGDLVTAVLGAGYFHDLSLDDVAKVALNFIDKTLQRTLSLKRDLRFGLSYEPYLPDLALQIKQLMEEKA